VRRSLRWLLLALPPLALACHRTPDPCSPWVAVVVDNLCIEATVATAERECPDASVIADCPPARAVLESCEALMAAQDAGCRRE
jgi:hypothetical protein